MNEDDSEYEYEINEIEYEDEVLYINKTNKELIEDVKKVVKVINRRSQKRDAYDGEMLLTVELENGMIDENYQFVKLVVPDVVIHEDMIQILKVWAKTAKLYPHAKRNCLITNEKTVKGSLFCEKYQYYQEYVDSF